MSNPAPLPHNALQPAAEPFARPDFRLWRDAPAWRNLLLAAIGISAALIAVPLTDSGADQGAQDLAACHAKQVPISNPDRQGQVVGFLSTDQANSAVQRTQAELGMPISPDYNANTRSLVHLDGGAQGSRYIYLVPQGMNVRIGDHVEITGWRTDPNLPCHYIPAIITRDLSQ